MDVHYTIMNTIILNSFCTHKWRCRMMWLVWWGFITTAPVFNFLIMIAAKRYGTWMTQFIDPWPWTRRNRLLLSKRCHFLRCLFSFYFSMHLWLSALWTTKRFITTSKLKMDYSMQVTIELSTCTNSEVTRVLCLLFLWNPEKKGSLESRIKFTEEFSMIEVLYTVGRNCPVWNLCTCIAIINKIS